MEYNAVGTAVWSLLEERRSLDAIVEALMRDHDVDEATCRRDVQAFLAELERAGFVSALASNHQEAGSR
jgi:hypothetical protein